MNRILSRWKSISVERKLYLVVGTMATLIACELYILKASMEQVSAVRAFVSGEALWSKAQKDALLALKNFQKTGNERQFSAFLNNLVVPEGDHLARIELTKSRPNFSLVRKGFIQGRINPDDIDRMVDLLRRFYWVSNISTALQDWAEADILLGEVKATGDLIHAAVRSKDEPASVRLMDHMDILNSKLTSIEEHFSNVLGEGSRRGESLVLWLILAMILFVGATGLTLIVKTGREIAKIATENGRLYNEARQSLHMRDEFLSVASHELKTPLTALGLQLQLLHQVALKPSSQETTSHILTLSNQTLVSIRRLSSLLGELLDLTRIRIGHFELHRQTCNLTGVIQDSIAQLGAEAAKAGSAVTVRSTEAVAGWFDAVRMSQVVINLLSNAIKYGQGKPIAILIEAYDSKVRIVVRDQGAGIPSDKMPRLFQRFERFEHDPTITGLGLGLYISNEIVKAHGGVLMAESKPGEGATFTAELPIQQNG